MKVINLDKNGKVIPDLTKVHIPDDIRDKYFEILERARDERATERARQRESSVKASR